MEVNGMSAQSAISPPFPKAALLREPAFSDAQGRWLHFTCPHPPRLLAADEPAVFQDAVTALPSQTALPARSRWRGRGSTDAQSPDGSGLTGRGTRNRGSGLFG